MNEEWKDLLTKSSPALAADLNIPVINKNANYWFLRTESGSRFEDFYFGSYIAIGYDSFNDLEYLKTVDDEELKNQVQDQLELESYQKPGSVSSTLKRFVCEMAIGDYVIIPSEGSNRFAFGIIESDSYIYEPTESELISLFFDNDESSLKIDFLKRRGIKWLKVLNRSDVDPFVVGIIHSHNTIVNANPYKVFINRSIFNFFFTEEDNKLHAVYHINKTKDLEAVEFYRFVKCFFERMDIENKKFSDLFEENSISEKAPYFKENELFMKATVNSPGPVELALFAGAGTLLLSAVSIFFFGGNFNSSFKFFGQELSFKFKTDGLIKSIMNYKKQNYEQESEKNRIAFERSMQELQLKTYSKNQLEPEKTELLSPAFDEDN